MRVSFRSLVACIATTFLWALEEPVTVQTKHEVNIA